MKQVWQCDFCSETSTNMELMALHEANCNYNPENRCCPTCVHEDDSTTYPECWVVTCRINADAGLDLDDKCPNRVLCPSWRAQR